MQSLKQKMMFAFIAGYMIALLIVLLGHHYIEDSSKVVKTSYDIALGYVLLGLIPGAIVSISLTKQSTIDETS